MAIKIMNSIKIFLKYLKDVPERQSKAKLQKRAPGNSTHLARDSEEPIHWVTKNILYHAVT
jgi:hypothetical protein